MLLKRSAAVVGIALSVVGLSGAGAKHYHSQARCLPGLPPRDYAYHDLSPSAIALSERAVALRAPVNPSLAVVGEATERIRLYQFIEAPALRVDHCFVLRPSVTLSSTGTWVVSFRAVQNPIVTANDPFLPIIRDEIREQVKQTSQILRNRFHVQVRGYAARPLANGPGATTLSAPVLFEAHVTPFWVERGVPREIRVSYDSPDVARYFDLIDRVEVEFRYEYQTGLRASQP